MGIGLMLFCILQLFAVEIRAAEQYSLPDGLTLSGWLDTVHSLQLRSPHDKITSRARLRLEARADCPWLYAFSSFDAEKNWIIDGETGIDTQELWVEHISDRWDVRLGRQIIIWGQADGVQITDIISPPNLTESITRELDEIRMPVEAVRWRFLGSTLTTEIIAIPRFVAAVYPTAADNPWALTAHPAVQPAAHPTAHPAKVDTLTLPVDEPGNSLKNTELAARISAYLAGLDLAASVFHTWDDTPTSHRSWQIREGRPLLLVQPRHHRLTVFGLEFSRPWADVVFRGESAFYKGRYLAGDGSLKEQPQKKDLVKWLFGLDWTPGNDWSITAQVLGDWIPHHQPGLAARPATLMGTLNIAKKLLNQRLTLSTMLYLDGNEGEFYDRLKADYEVADGFHLSAGIDFFYGDGGQFGVYEENSQAWCKIKYSF